jgi:cobyric acid synthase
MIFGAIFLGLVAFDVSHMHPFLCCCGHLQMMGKQLPPTQEIQGSVHGVKLLAA